MAAVVFLPTFLVGMNVELLLRGELEGRDFYRILDDQIFMFVALAFPLIVGSVFYSACSLLIPIHWTRSRPRLAAVAFSVGFVLIFALVLFLVANEGIAALSLVFLPSSIVAAVLYGFVAKIGRQETG
jgi:hypothetical protein